MAEDVEIVWDNRALEMLMVEIEPPLLEELTREVEDTARGIAPVRTRRTIVPEWAKEGYIGSPGHLKASVRSYVGRDSIGFYGDVAALWYGRFLDPPARQMKRVHHFLPSALFWTIEGRTYYL